MNLVAGFVESAGRHPGRIALEMGAEKISYAELGGRAATIAEALGPLAEAEPLVALLAYRSVSAYASVLGTLLAGKGYVAPNPHFPLPRCEEILRLAEVRTVLVADECLELLVTLLPRLDSTPLTLLLVDGTPVDVWRSRFPRHRWHSVASGAAAAALTVPDVRPDTPVYLAFTSGSTGKPKAVLAHQSHIAPYIESICNTFEVGERDRVSQHFDLNFDPSLHDMFVCWSRGACLVPTPYKIGLQFTQFAREAELTLWYSVPSVVNWMQSFRMLREGIFPTIRLSFFVGEALLDAVASRWHHAAPASRIENVYGLTETPGIITRYSWKPGGKTPLVPLGALLPGHDACLLGPDGAVLDGPAEGELCLTGTQVVTRYWRDEERSRARFGPLPGKGDAIWLRTGDRVRLDEQGCLHYVTRLDDQLKIAGFLTTLLSLDRALAEAAGTLDAVMVPWKLENGAAQWVFAFVAGSPHPEEAILER